MVEMSSLRYESQFAFRSHTTNSFGRWIEQFRKGCTQKGCTRTYAIIVRFPPISRAHRTKAVDSITHTTVGFDQRAPMCLITAVGMGGYFRSDSGLRPHGISN
jgi:hypothetical protein